MATRGIWIPIEIMHDDDLNHSQKFVLSEIEQLSQLEDGCYAQNSHFAKLTGITKTTVSKTISSLKDMGYIDIETEAGSRNHVRKISIVKKTTLVEMTEPPCHNDKPPLSKEQETKGNTHSNTHSKETVLAEYLSSSLERSLEKFKEPTDSTKLKWAKDIDKLMRLDGNTFEEVKQLIDWIHTGKGSFWISNVMSGKKLRDQFPKLWKQMSQDAPKPISAKNRILSEVGLGKVFFEYPDKDLDARVSVCLYGDYNALYDFYRNKYVDKDKAVKVWAYIDEHVNSILIKYRSKQS